MAYQNIEPFSKQLTIVIGLTVVGFMAFGLALSFYRNVLFEQMLANIDERNDILKQKIDSDYRQLEYYRSGQYKDKYAKENLGKVNPGERLLIITRERDTFIEDTEEANLLNEQQEAAYLELLRQMPIVEHWKMYLFHKDQMEELKRSFLRE